MNASEFWRRRLCWQQLLRLFIISVLLLVLAKIAHAESLFKCLGADGVSSYQSSPCAQPAQQIWQREVTPEPYVAAQHSPAHRPVAARKKKVRVRSAKASAPRVNACTKARAAADEERDLRWYTITFDRLRQLDDMVARACKKS